MGPTCLRQLLVASASLVMLRYMVATAGVTYAVGSNRTDEKGGPKFIKEAYLVKRQTLRTNSSRMWPYLVNYYYDNSMGRDNKAAFYNAAKEWERGTCINFTRNQSAVNAIRVMGEPNICQSKLGRMGGHQYLYLGNGCVHFGHAAHEIGHALGLHHTQNRFDRKNYINITWRNLPEDRKPQYRKCTKIDCDGYDVPYDYGSVMHYGSPRKNRTMKTVMPHYGSTIGSPMISFLDLYLVNKLYGCIDQCNTSSTKCENGGFPHPRNCSKCICPSGYGGILCDKKPDDGGEKLNATSDWKNKLIIFQSVGRRTLYENRTYWIESPNGTKTVVYIAGINSDIDVEGCVKAGVEIKTEADQRITGRRFCSELDRGIILTSHTNLVPIIVYSYYSRSVRLIVKLYYRSVTNAEITTGVTLNNHTQSATLINNTQLAIEASELRPAVSLSI